MYKVLVIDDEHMIKKSLTAIIERSNTSFHVVAEASDGREGLEQAKVHYPHLVITDIRMPELDGLELVEQFDRHNLDVISVIVSGYDEFNYAQQALRFGVLDYLLKPIKPDEVVKVMKQAETRLRQSANYSREQQIWNRFCRDQCLNLMEAIWILDERKIDESLHQLDQKMKANTFREISVADQYRTVLQQVVQQLEQRAAQDGSWTLPDFARYRSDHEVKEAVRCFIQGILDQLREQRNFSRHHKIQEAIQYVRAHYACPDTTLQVVADYVDMSTSYFSRSFKEESGLSFVQFITRLRMEEAKELLKDPYMKTYEIAERIGYYDYPHFSKMFKKYNGMSPMEFRDRIVKG